MGTFQRMYSTHSTQHSASLITVERAQPLLPQSRTSTKNRSPPMFSTELIIRKYSALLLSPSARMVAARKL